MLAPRPPGRFIAAFIDFFVWAVTMGVATWTTDTVVRFALGWPSPAPLEYRDTLTILSVGCGAFCANLCLAGYAARGRSPGKALLGLRLVAAGDPDRPGWGRGLVRSSLQAGPYMGALTVLTGLHDVFAGTRIVAVDERRAVDRVTHDQDDEGSGIALWKVGLAVLVHAFFAFVWMIIAAL